MFAALALTGHDKLVYLRREYIGCQTLRSPGLIYRRFVLYRSSTKCTYAPSKRTGLVVSSSKSQGFGSWRARWTRRYRYIEYIQVYIVPHKSAFRRSMIRRYSRFRNQNLTCSAKPFERKEKNCKIKIHCWTISWLTFPEIVEALFSTRFPEFCIRFFRKNSPNTSVP